MGWPHKKYILSLLLLPLIAFLNACGAEDTPVIVTEIPTNTPSQQAPPTATFTLAPTVAAAEFVNTITLIPTIERRRDLTATSGPSPTSPLRPTFTPAPATLTVTSLPTLAGIEIEYFANETTGALAPGANVTLFWRVTGAERVSIYRLDAKGERTKEWRVDNEGRITVATESTDIEEAVFELVASNADGVANEEVRVPLAAANCAQLWFFSPVPATCPNGPGEPIFQVEQRFEHGFMIWLGNTREIIIVYSDDQQPRWLRVPDAFTDGQPERDDSIQPPPNLFQPIRGFGLLWRENPRTRERLGWATEPELGYDGIVQISGVTDNDRVIYLRTRDGGILELSENGGAWQILPYQPPIVVPPSPTPTP